MSDIHLFARELREFIPSIPHDAVNGERQWINCQNNSADEIHKWITLLRGQTGDSSTFRLRKQWHTDAPSIQGPWTPFTHKAPALNVVQYPEEQLSRPLDVQPSATEQLIQLYEQQKLEQAQQQ